MMARTAAVAGGLVVALSLGGACAESGTRPGVGAVSGEAHAPAGSAGPREAASVLPAARDAPRSAAPDQPGGPPPARWSSPACPADMRMIPAGRFWIGLEEPPGGEEWPRHEVGVAAFCLDRTEVTVRAYRECVGAGACTEASAEGRFCNARITGRDDHPVNCVTWRQAREYCLWKGRRLPGEIEWEYAARGGPEQRRYSWGNDPPDGRTCWKHPGGTCAVGVYAPGAFDLLDMTGNVWEWTLDRYGPYPFPPPEGDVRSYRGGSWSRRFEKWMRPGLRNRGRESESGSHLGFRCALTAGPTPCAAAGAEDGACLRQVLQVRCGAGESWNGARCAARGQPRCGAGREELPGHGCVPVGGSRSGPLPAGAEEPVRRARTPEHDADCARHQPARPRAFRFEGASHAARNRESRALGCRNRDVGAGWNSCCCPG